MNRVIVVVGPTAVGKTKVAIDLAKHYGLDVISGDSIAIYKELDIGSAKPTLEEQRLVKHHLIDILDVHEEYSAYDFQVAARKLIEKNPLSLICGGTGLYIQSALFDYEFEAAKRNDDYAKKYEGYSNNELYELLKSRDSKFDEKRIHPNNRKRVLRALEVLETTGKSIMDFSNASKPLYDYFIVYLSMDRKILYQRINDRVDLMIKNGLIAEARKLYQKDCYIKGIGYGELFEYFKGQISLEEAIAEIKKNSRHLAKRQETWFRNQMLSHFYDITDYTATLNKIIKDIDEWLKQ